MLVHASRKSTTLIWLALLLPAPTTAQEAPPPQAAPVLKASTLPPCTCRAGGQSYDIGARVCIGSRMMRCEMAINVTSWAQTGDACPES